MLFGLMLAYIINYGFYFTHDSIQWRFPLLFQLVFAAYILCLTPFLPDSPRWLLRHDDSSERGLLVLANLRNKTIDDLTVRKEADDIIEAIELESRVEGSWMDLFRDGGLQTNKRFYLALGIQFMQQLSGINIVTYYAPTIFQSSLGMSGRMSLLMGLLLQVWYFVASFVTWFTIDRIGRRKLFISMALGMCAVLIAEAVCVAISNKSAGIGAVFFVFAFEACFTWGWMATVWVYPAEILPLSIRAKGAALAAAADFLGNFLVVEVTPVGVANLGFGFYFIWAALNFINAAIVWLFYPETANLPLESVDLLFTSSALAKQEKQPFHRKLQWSVVGRAAAESKRKRDLHVTELGHADATKVEVGGGKMDQEHVERL
ncbi:hypothetical protein AAFC00_002400 [Neodothiora populina]|uniref:Major facilitator superfamily (MFS) profile domain-containing protein n=1 Tax=Neodothiora populina TaxID=2781224 RepID=A0ABR3P8B8_9PEZI